MKPETENGGNGQMENEKEEMLGGVTDEQKVQPEESAEEVEPQEEDLLEIIRTLEEDNRVLREAAARARADFFNFRQRVERERDKNRKLAVENAVGLILPVIDNFDRALAAPDQGDAASLMKGVSMLRSQLASVLVDLGVEEIGAVGEMFDPSVHEAVAVEAADGSEKEGMVTGELQKGYMLGDRVLRAAKVKVAGKPAGAGDRD